MISIAHLLSSLAALSYPTPKEQESGRYIFMWGKKEGLLHSPAHILSPTASGLGPNLLFPLIGMAPRLRNDVAGQQRTAKSMIEPRLASRLYVWHKF